MNDFMTLDDFTNKVEEEADSFQSNISTMNELDETEEGDTPFIYQAIRVDFRAEDEEFIKSAYEDYLDYNIQEGNFDLQDVLDSLDNLTLTMTDKSNSANRIVAGEDKNGEADFESVDDLDLNNPMIEEATITSIYHSDELDKWCVDADIDHIAFTGLKSSLNQEDKNGEPSND